MSLYSIPEEDFHGFTLLGELSKEKTKQLANALENSTIGKSVDELAEELADKLEIEKKDLLPILSILYSIYIIKTDASIPEDELLKDIISSLKHASFPVKNFENKLSNNLSQLLSLDGSIGLTIKTISLGKEYEKILVNAKILTDIRPAFANLNKFDAAIIVHSLKIEYQTGERHEDIVLTLSLNGLKMLKDQIVRAEKKEELIKKSMDKNIKIINPQPGIIKI